MWYNTGILNKRKVFSIITALGKLNVIDNTAIAGIYESGIT